MEHNVQKPSREVVTKSKPFTPSRFAGYLFRFHLASARSGVQGFTGKTNLLGFKYIDEFDLSVYFLVANQFRSSDYSFGRLQLFCLYILSCTRVRVTNCSIVTSQMNQHMI